MQVVSCVDSVERTKERASRRRRKLEDLEKRVEERDEEYKEGETFT
jgi:hypothetical protein